LLLVGAANADQRATFLAADARLQGDAQADVSSALAQLDGYPLKAYLEYRVIERNLKTVAPEVVAEYLSANQDLAVVGDLKRAWLRELMRQGRDEEFARFDVADLSDAELNCHSWHLRGAAADAEFIEWFKQALELKSACTALARELHKAERLAPAVINTRIQRAFDEGRGYLGVASARSWATAELPAALAAAKLSSNPFSAKKHTSSDPYARAALRGALVKLARRDHASALSLLNAVSVNFKFADADLWAVRREVAVYSAVALEPIAWQRLSALPAHEHTAQSRLWRVRSALLSGDALKILAALDALDATEAASSLAGFWRGRAHTQLDQADLARAAFERAAAIPDFYGFAASDELKRAPALCKRTAPKLDPTFATRNLSVARAVELRAINRETLARREWNQALLGASDADRAQMAALALELKWYRQAVITLAREADRRLYDLRFPLAWERQVSTQARRQGLNPALIYAVMRAESALDPNAQSGANAHGLMQLLPSTAAVLARQLRLRFDGVADLRNPRFNIRLGTAYLAGRMADHQQDVIATLAAYNAGPNVLKRWQTRIPGDDRLRFIELIPYAETRDYVQRVIGFAMVYDYQLNSGSLRPLHDWTQTRTSDPLLKPVCL